MISSKEVNQYKTNGYLILPNFIAEDRIDELNSKYKLLRKKLAKRASIKFDDYENEISQIRDLWKLDNTFRDLILEKEIFELAPLFFEDNSCRLLHDHVINKPQGRNGVVPWHQDYTYWPVDNPGGLSFWLPFSDLGENSGIIEAVPRSHLWGEEKPIDFMNDTKNFDESNIKRLTVKKGDLVILHSLTWHRTSKNTSSMERIAYISLWIPANSKYMPKHASWHPVNDNVTVKEGETLNNDWFPIIGDGKYMESQIEYVDNTHTEDMDKMTMFNASRIAKGFLVKELDLQSDIWSYLYSASNRQVAVNTLAYKYGLDNSLLPELDDVLLSMSINGMAYQNHRARNVYNDSYLKFKSLFFNEI